MADDYNETAAIVGLYGEVDRAVQEDGAARKRVARLLSPYEDPELHWYDDFLKWQDEEADARGEERIEGAAPPFPDLRSALTLLSEWSPPRPRMRARRMFALAVTAAAHPELKQPGHELRDLAIEALRVMPALPNVEPSQNQAESVYKLLSGEDEGGPINVLGGPGTDQGWDLLIQKAVEGRVLPNDTGARPRPCTSGMVRVPGMNGLVDALGTEFVNTKVDFARATRYLEPLNWQVCRPDFWSKVDLLEEPSPGMRLYHEVVSTHCGEPGRRGFWAETDLLVNFMLVSDSENGDAAIANYKLAKPPQPEDFIQVDEGTLVVAKQPGAAGILVSSTKRIKFRREIPLGYCAVMMCALGYGDAAADLIACAAREGRDPPLGTEFPGVPLGSATNGLGARAQARPAGGAREPAGGLIQQLAEIWVRAIREGATAVERNLGGAPKRPGQRG